MNLQYISDSNGMPTGVFIPINEWNELKEKYGDLDHEVDDLPQWQKDELDRRFEQHKNNPDDVLDFDEAMDDIEKEL